MSARIALYTSDVALTDSGKERLALCAEPNPETKDL